MKKSGPIGPIEVVQTSTEPAEVQPHRKKENKKDLRMMKGNFGWNCVYVELDDIVIYRDNLLRQFSSRNDRTGI